MGKLRLAEADISDISDVPQTRVFGTAERGGPRQNQSGRRVSLADSNGSAPGGNRTRAAGRPAAARCLAARGARRPRPWVATRRPSAEPLHRRTRRYRTVGNACVGARHPGAQVNGFASCQSARVVQRAPGDSPAVRTTVGPRRDVPGTAEDLQRRSGTAH